MYREFSDKQMEIIQHGESELTSCFAGGAVRSGKTTASAVGFATFTLAHGHKSEHFLVGQSVEVVMRNVGFDLLDIYQNLGTEAYFTRTLGSCIVIPYKGTDVRVWVIGAADERSQKRIQGSTAKGMLVDEGPVMPEGFFQMAWSRLSEEGAKLWCTYNPEGPRHWFKLTVIDRVEKYDGKIVHCSLDDNPSLGDNYKKRIKSSTTGHWHKRWVEGKWAGATGLIFPRWKVMKRTPKDLAEYQVSLDWGVSSVFAALCFKVKGQKAQCVSELYDDVRKAEETSVETERAGQVHAWLEMLEAPRNTVIWLDPSTPLTFKRCLRQYGYRVRNADNDVLPGIVTTGARLASGDITIHERCTSLLDEIGSYSWDEKKTEIGEDAPKKANDHACDALRYFAHSTGKVARVQPTSLKKVGINAS